MNDAKPRITERILPSPHPVRISRPDQLKRTWLIIGKPSERIQVRRHWNAGAGKTEACRCEPMCSSGREDYFCPALQMLPGVSEGERVWEPVVLHCTETTVRGIYITMRARRDDGDLQGILAILQRVGGGNGRVASSGILRCPVSPHWPRIDVGAVLLDRMGVSADFFGKRFDSEEEAGSNGDQQEEKGINTDQVANPARQRIDPGATRADDEEQAIRDKASRRAAKPRVPKGKG